MRGGAGETIRWTRADTSLGPLLIAATPRGLCRVAFDEDYTGLATRFPAATILPADAALAGLARAVVAQVEAPGRDHDLPLDVRGTAFQEAVWQALRRVPAGSSVGYAALAAMADAPPRPARRQPAARTRSRSFVPCHRARRGDGGAGGYAWGLDRKAALLERERNG
ncbi:methylated-DNA--[protein]-cysteine S-methyltransferase [Sphingomonas sp. MMS24-JH45]